MKKWLETPAKGWFEKSLTVIAGLSVAVIWMLLISRLSQFVPMNLLNGDFIYYVITSCLIAPIWEEFAFREFPARVAKKLGADLLYPTLLFSSIIFGWGHGQEMASLLKQGVLGVIFSFVYIKNGHSYLSAVTTHGLWNLLVYILNS